MRDYTTKLAELDGVKSFDELSDEQTEFLKKCLQHHDGMVRYDAVSLLGRLEPSEDVIRLIKQRLWDKDELVASDASESLRALGDEGCIEALIKRLNARSVIVRAYTVVAIADLCAFYNHNIDEVKRLLKLRMKREKDAWLLSDYYCALYLLGEKGYLEPLLKGLRSRDYRIRASTVSLIKDFVFDDEQSMQKVRDYALKYMDKTTREYEALLKAL